MFLVSIADKSSQLDMIPNVVIAVVVISTLSQSNRKLKALSTDTSQEKCFGQKLEDIE